MAELKDYFQESDQYEDSDVEHVPQDRRGSANEHLEGKESSNAR